MTCAGLIASLDSGAVVRHGELPLVDDETSWRKTLVIYCALLVVFFVVPIGFAYLTAKLIRFVFGRGDIHDPVVAGGVAGAFVIGMLVSGDIVIPWLYRILPASLVKGIRKTKRRR